MKFLHSRAESFTLSPNGNKQYYYKGYTAAYLREGDAVLIGIARCGRDDVFCKSKGRVIAEGRLKKKPIVLSYVGKNTAEAVRNWCNNWYFDEISGVEA